MISQKDRLVNIENAVSAFNSKILTDDDLKFGNFLNSLTLEAKEAYFYIEAQRINQFIKELSCYQISNINDLRNPENRKKIPLGNFNAEQAIKNIIDFWEMFGCFPKPFIKVINEIIAKFEYYIRQLTDEEKLFFFENSEKSHSEFSTVGATLGGKTMQ